jgi:hypothetical protein
LTSAIRWLAIPLVVVTLAASVVCGGDDDDDTGETGTPAATEDAASDSGETAPSSDSTSEEEPTGTPTEEADGDESEEDDSEDATSTGTATNGASAGPEPTSDISESFVALQSYRYTIEVEVEAENPEEIFGASDENGGTESALFSAGRMSISGAAAGDDLDVTLEFPETATIRTIQIAGEQFTKVNSNPWLGPQTPEPTGLRPADLFAEGFFTPEDLEGLEYEQETLNGVETRHYTITRSEFEALEDLLGSTSETQVEQASVDVWIAEVGEFPVRMEIYASGTDDAAGAFTMQLTLDVTDINAAVIIERPVE